MLLGSSSFTTRRACVSVGTTQRATMCGHRSMGGALMSVGLRVTIIVEVLSQAAAERAAGHARTAFAVVANAADVAVRFVGKENVGPQVDRLRCALQAFALGGQEDQGRWRGRR